MFPLQTFRKFTTLEVVISSKKIFTKLLYGNTFFSNDILEQINLDGPYSNICSHLICMIHLFIIYVVYISMLSNISSISSQCYISSALKVGIETEHWLEIKPDS